MRLGQGVTYYDEGWRYGTVVSLPIKGQHKGRVRIEHPHKGFTKVDGQWVPKAAQKFWVPVANVNEPGVFTFSPAPILAPVVVVVAAPKAPKPPKTPRVKGKAKPTPGKKDKRPPVAGQPKPKPKPKRATRGR